MTRFPAGPADSPGFLLWRVTLHWQRVMAEVLRPLGLTHVQFVLLASTWWLNGQGQTPKQATIAGHADTDIKMTSEILRKLQDKGLVDQVTDPADRRARVVTVTPAGAALAQRAITVVEQADADFFGTVPKTFVGHLQTLSRFEGKARPDEPW